jgi:hypothetical protein
MAGSDATEGCSADSNLSLPTGDETTNGCKDLHCSPIPGKRLHAGVAEECRRVSLGPATVLTAVLVIHA